MNLDIVRSPRVLAAFAAVIAAAVYLNSLANGFALDDVYIIELNNRAHDPLDFDRIWLTPYWPFYGQELGLYRPVVIFLYAVQWAAGSGEPWLFHAVSIVLHGLVTLLVYALLVRLTRPLPAFVGAMIFAVHPVHTEAVANVVGQAELVAAALVLSAVIVHAGRPAGAAVPWPRRVLLVLLYLLALGTKESSIVLPALLILLDVFQRRVVPHRDSMRQWLAAMAMPFFLLAAALVAYLLLRMDVMGGTIAGVDAAPAMPYLSEEYRVLNALRAFPEFLRLLFFPQELSSDYTPAVILPVEDVRPMVVLGATLLLGIAVLAGMTPWFPRLGFPAAWFLLTMVTVLNLFFPIGVLVAERTLYLPSFAVSALAAIAWTAAAPHASPAMRKLAPALVAIAIVLMGVRTWIRNPDWKDTPTVWDAVYRDHPHSYRAQWVRAALLQQRGRPDLAAGHYRLAYEIYSRDYQFNAQYGNFLMSQGRYEEAMPVLQEAHAMQPYVPANGVILAFGQVATGRYEEALEVLRRMAVLEHINVSTLMALRAYAYRGLGRLDDAAGALRAAVTAAADSAWRTRAILARSFARAGYTDRASQAFDSARALAPDSAARVTIDQAEAAMRAGCYAPEPRAQLADGFAGYTGPACDPLDEWFPFAPPAQNATALQNATEQGVAGAPPDSASGSKQLVPQ